MSIRVRNIALLAIAAVAAGYGAFRMAHQPYSYAESQSRPWIPPPRTGMDASTEAVRVLLLRDTNLLAASCSQAPDSPRVERYVLGIGRDAWAPIWGIDISVRGSEIEAAIGDIAWMPPAPPPGVQSEGDDEARPPPLRVKLTLAQMQQISGAWNDESLWHAPQQMSAFQCVDGRPISLESCVDGRYYARMRNCGGNVGASTERLWRVVSPLLPAPKP